MLDHVQLLSEPLSRVEQQAGAKISRSIDFEREHASMKGYQRVQNARSRTLVVSKPSGSGRAAKLM